MSHCGLNMSRCWLNGSSSLDDGAIDGGKAIDRGKLIVGVANNGGAIDGGKSICSGETIDGIEAINGNDGTVLARQGSGGIVCGDVIVGEASFGKAIVGGNG